MLDLDMLARHPELDKMALKNRKYLAELPKSVKERFHFLERDDHGFWGYRNGVLKKAANLGILDIYDGLDRFLEQSPLRLVYSVGTQYLGQRGEVVLYLLPYGRYAQEVARYLEQFKHASVLGFARLAVAQLDGERLFYVDTMQTDLMRREKEVIVNGGKPSVRIGSYTVPSKLRSAYLDGEQGEMPWHAMILGTLEQALDTVGVEGVVMPTFRTLLSAREEIRALRASGFVRSIYTRVPEKRGYKRRLLGQQGLNLTFPLNFGMRQVGEETGTYWVKEKGSDN